MRSTSRSNPLPGGTSRNAREQAGRVAPRKRTRGDFPMAKRIALVTGGMGGLGEAICMKLEKMGIDVVVTYSPGNTKYQDWLKEMESQGHKFRAYPCDVSDFDSCQKCVAQITKEVGPIDILIN